MPSSDSHFVRLNVSMNVELLKKVDMRVKSLGINNRSEYLRGLAIQDLKISDESAKTGEQDV